jgi:hypothetical protein
MLFIRAVSIGDMIGKIEKGLGALPIAVSQAADRDPGRPVWKIFGREK